MIFPRKARALLAAIPTLLVLACGGETETATGLCERLQSCDVVQGEAGLAICNEQLTAAGDGSRSCEACLDGASCSDVKADACKKPCLGVIEAVGGEPPPVSQPGSSGGGTDPRDPPEPQGPPPAAVESLCNTLAQCRIRASNSLSCVDTYLFGLSRNLVTLIEIGRCDQCIQLNACDLQSCQLACSHVL